MHDANICVCGPVDGTHSGLLSRSHGPETPTPAAPTLWICAYFFYLNSLVAGWCVTMIKCSLAELFVWAFVFKLHGDCRERSNWWPFCISQPTRRIYTRKTCILCVLTFSCLRRITLMWPPATENHRVTSMKMEPFEQSYRTNEQSSSRRDSTVL